MAILNSSCCRKLIETHYLEIVAAKELWEQYYLMLNKTDSAIFINESTNDSIKIIMCNNRDFGAINEKYCLD